MLSARYNSIKRYLATGQLPKDVPSTSSNFRKEASSYTLENGIVKRDGKLVALHKDRSAIFDCFHKTHSGNISQIEKKKIILGRDITWQKISERYYWCGGQHYVAKKVKECIACAYKNNTLWKAGLPKLTAIPVTPKVFYRVHIDFMGPLSQSRNGNSYIGLAVCAFTKFVEGAGNKLNKF